MLYKWGPEKLTKPMNKYLIISAVVFVGVIVGVALAGRHDATPATTSTDAAS